MKKKIKTSSRFKKDLKHYKHNKIKLNKLKYIITLLEMGIKLPKEYKQHPLKGNYVGHLECHIEDDFLLIWIDPNDNSITLERLGSHSQLFR